MSSRGYALYINFFAVATKISASFINPLNLPSKSSHYGE